MMFLGMLQVLLAYIGGTVALNITTDEKVVWMEFPELLTVVRKHTHRLEGHRHRFPQLPPSCIDLPAAG